MPRSDGELSDIASNWIAGLLQHADAACVMTNPTVNSYKRFSPFQFAPNRIQWTPVRRGDRRPFSTAGLSRSDDGAARVWHGIYQAIVRTDHGSGWPAPWCPSPAQYPRSARWN